MVPGPTARQGIGHLDREVREVRACLAPGGTASARAAAVDLRMRRGVSSLESSDPSAACWASSSNAGARLGAAAATKSHWVVAGRRMARACCRRAMRWNGSPQPYLSSAIMAAAPAPP
jgi:hypothetical protein